MDQNIQDFLPFQDKEINESKNHMGFYFKHYEYKFKDWMHVIPHIIINNK
jgi:hypothetical protein